jgi:methyl-accepting chemotaxis protein
MNMRLTTYLQLALAVLALLMTGIATLGYRGISNVEQQLAGADEVQMATVRACKVVSDAYLVTIPTVAAQFLQGRASGDALAAVQAARQHATDAWKSYLARPDATETKNSAANAASLVSAADLAAGQLLDLLQRGDRDALRDFLATGYAHAVDPLFPGMEQLSDLQHQALAAKVHANRTDEGSLKVELIISTAVALALVIGLGFALTRVTRDLRSLVQNAQTAGVQVSTSVTEIAATAKQHQATANEIAATTTEIGATSKEISATSKELVKTMGEVADGAEQTAALAGRGHAGLGRMEEMMRHVMEAAGAINAKLAVLNEKAGNINQVVTTITKVADQTNLLSLNAAIEAEKAGEYGRGFAVVATEIRRLADQTGVATYDIEQIVKEMLSAVSASVMGMDKFSEEVRRGVDEVRNVSSQLTQIIEQVQGLTPQFETVNEGMQAQATGAQQISEALTQLGEAAQQTVESLRQSNAAIEQLNETAFGLRGSVERIAA